MKHIYSDGGRSKYYKMKDVGDCVARAICNATGSDYKEVYDSLNLIAKNEKTSVRKNKKSNARNGVFKYTYKKYLENNGWEWHACSGIGIGCTMHLNENELPSGTLILSLSKHLTCVKNKVLYDTYDCNRDGERCVYGYWKKSK